MPSSQNAQLRVFVVDARRERPDLEDEVTPGTMLLSVEDSTVSGDNQLAVPIEIEGLRQQDAGAREGHIPRVVVKAER